MDAQERLGRQVEQELDDVLATLQLVHGDDLLEGRLFEQLVDLLVERLFLDLRRHHREELVEQDAHLARVAGLAAQCRAVGLLPLTPREA